MQLKLKETLNLRLFAVRFYPESWCNKLSIKHLRKKFQGQLYMNKIKKKTS